MRLLGPALFVVSAITSVFLTPAHITNSILNFGLEHSPFHNEVPHIYEENSLRVPESTSYLEDKLRTLDPQLVLSNSRIKELEQETEIKDEQLLTLQEHYNKLKNENANLFAQLSPKSKNGTVFTTSWSIYFFRGFTLIVTLIFLVAVFRYFRERENKKIEPTVMPCICDDGNPPEEQLVMNKSQTEEVASSRPQSSITNLTEELSQERIPMDTFSDSDAPTQSLTEDELVKGSIEEDEVASSELANQVPNDNLIDYDERDSKRMSESLDKKDFDTNNEPDVTGSFIGIPKEEGSLLTSKDRHITESEPNPLLQSFVQL